jgi:hypothetical protein
MVIVLIVSLLLGLCVAVVSAIWTRHTRELREMERHFMTAEGLHTLLASGREILLFDRMRPTNYTVDLA